MGNFTKYNIQFWRLFACACVFMVHFGQRIGLEGTTKRIVDFGAQGVYMFFIISGYLIANSMTQYGKNNISFFIKKKLMKLLPLYYIVIIYYFIIHTFVLRDITHDPTGWGWIRYIIPLNGILPKTNTYFWDNLGITWTIPYFVFAYILLPICLRYISNYKGAAILLLISFIACQMVPMFHGYMTVVKGLVYFCEGVFVFFVCKDHKEHGAYIILNFLFLACVVIGDLSSMAYSLMFMCMILATDGIEIKSILLKKILAISDKYSYTLYLIHGIIFIHILDRQCWGRMYEAIIAIVGSVILSYFVHTYLECPLQKKLNVFCMNLNKNR